jgi:hypothetical protein
MPEEYEKNDDPLIGGKGGSAEDQPYPYHPSMDQPTEPYRIPPTPYYPDAPGGGQPHSYHQSMESNPERGQVPARAEGVEGTVYPHPDPRFSFEQQDTAQLPNYIPYFQSAPPVVPPAPERKRGLRFTPKNIVIFALIVLLVMGSASALFVYLTRSTPNRTLDAFCSALVQSDYQHAYQQFVPGLQHAFSEKVFADMLTRNRVAQCTYTPVDEASGSVQTELRLLHTPIGANDDQVTLGKDTHGTWQITDLHVARPQSIPRQAAVHHLKLASNQALSGLATVFAANGGGTETGLAVAAGERVVILASGKMSMTAGGTPVGADGISSCPGTSLPVPSLNCLSLLYSLGAISQVNEAGTRADFTVQTPGVLFIGLNVPYQSRLQGTFQLTVLTIPDRTATALWQQPERNGFVFSLAGTFQLSAQIFAQHYADHISAVHFYLERGQGAETSICQAPYDGISTTVSCSWDLRAGEESNGSGTPISNGPIRIGFSLIITDTSVERNPDGIISGIARYIANVQSENYSGYAAQSIDQPQPTHYHSATMSWTVPAVQCGAGEISASGIWAGMTGSSDKSQLAQTGTASGCQDGSPVYYAWWEMFPAPAHLINMPLFPGDQVTSSVTYQQGQFQLTLDNASEHWHFTTTQAGSDNDNLVAECVVEAPAFSDTTLAPLSNFGSVSATCKANGQPIGVTGPQNLVFQMAGSRQHATTSSLDLQGSNFTVQWKSS